MKNNSNKRSFIFGAPQCRISRLPPINPKNLPKVKSQKLELKSPAYSTSASSDSSPMMRNHLSGDFLPYIYAQNGMECVKTQFRKLGTPISLLFKLEKKKSSVNLIEDLPDEDFRSQQKAFTYDTLDLN